MWWFNQNDRDVRGNHVNVNEFYEPEHTHACRNQSGDNMNYRMEMNGIISGKEL